VPWYKLAGEMKRKIKLATRPVGLKSIGSDISVTVPELPPSSKIALAKISLALTGVEGVVPEKAPEFEKSISSRAACEVLATAKKLKAESAAANLVFLKYVFTMYP
jgi:hypothetical protein